RCARQMFGNDPVTDLVLKAASSPATIASPTWAGNLSRQVIDDTIADIASLSAAADLIGQGTRLNFDAAGSIRIPGRAFAANNADAGQWVAEEAPIPLRAQSFTSGVVLSPRKLAVIVAYTREMAESSNIEQISRALISESAALALDAALLSNFAGDSTRPPGLLAGLTPITPTALTGNI